MLRKEDIFPVILADFRESGVEQSKRTHKQNIFDKMALRHSEGSARRIYIKSTRNSIDIASWAYRKTKSEIMKIIPL